MLQRKKPAPGKRVTTFRSDADRKLAFETLLQRYGSGADLLPTPIIKPVTRNAGRA